MSDERLRELERRYKETGDLEDEAMWLKHRVRTGQPLRLELAAIMGYPPARRALALLEYEDAHDQPLSERVAAVHLTPSGDPRRFLQDMQSGGKEAVVRGGVAALRAALTEKDERRPWEPLVNAVEVWAASPDASSADAVAALVEEAWSGAATTPLPAALTLARAVNEKTLRATVKRCGSAAYYVRGFGNEALIAAICAELVPWALGTGDPVRERVRQRESG